MVTIKKEGIQILIEGKASLEELHLLQHSLTNAITHIASSSLQYQDPNENPIYGLATLLDSLLLDGKDLFEIECLPGSKKLKLFTGKEQQKEVSNINIKKK